MKTNLQEKQMNFSLLHFPTLFFAYTSSKFPYTIFAPLIFVYKASHLFILISFRHRRLQRSKMLRPLFLIALLIWCGAAVPTNLAGSTKVSAASDRVCLVYPAQHVTGAPDFDQLLRDGKRNQSHVKCSPDGSNACAAFLCVNKNNALVFGHGCTSDVLVTCGDPTFPQDGSRIVSGKNASALYVCKEEDCMYGLMEAVSYIYIYLGL